ncbi:hypothetical protein ABZ154_26255 [Streptomyces sp. NPDC006261]|uniref:hypothetical protein n=1 Tax=Streptomyces sp. NPDC006261 TaxID=3156739 RepID=UPI0033B1AD19
MVGTALSGPPSRAGPFQRGGISPAHDKLTGIRAADRKKRTMDLISATVGMLVVWAAGKSRRVGVQFNGLTDQALDAAAERVRELIVTKLGGDPAIRRLLAESEEQGEASSTTRADAENAVKAAVDRDHHLAAALREALENKGDNDRSRGPNYSGANATNVTGDNNKVNTKVDNSVITNIIHAAERNKVWTALGAIALLGLITGLFIWAGGGDSSDDATGSPPLAGSWTSSDDTGIKTFGDDGQCTGFYYNNGKPLDIGGPMRCSLSTQPDEAGQHTLTVVQSPNEAAYKVRFDGTDHALVYSSTGRKLYELNRS